MLNISDTAVNLRFPPSKNYINTNILFEECFIFLVIVLILLELGNLTGPLAKWVECLLMVQKTRVQSQVESSQRLKKIALDAALLNTQRFKVRIKSQVEQSREWNSALPYTSV